MTDGLSATSKMKSRFPRYVPDETVKAHTADETTRYCSHCAAGRLQRTWTRGRPG